MPEYPNADMDRQAAGKQCAAVISYVQPYSPADDAGFEPGCKITSVDGQPLRDVIDWRWLTADDVVDLGYVDLDGDEGVVTLEREPGEDWGIEFDGVVFDRVKLCRNACIFCFMQQLPKGMRPSLTLRDDDFRLSFLSGTFVTLTNLKPEDEQRIVQQRISPLRVSLHASDEDVRRRIIGRHAMHGLQAMDRLLAAGIQMHGQIVLMPGQNDGEVLQRTLEWAFARPNMLNVGIVPLGFTRFQDRFTQSFNSMESAGAVISIVQRFQQRALAERGNPWVYAADEFYGNAFPHDLLEQLPPASFYDDFSMFEDGIGIIRSAVDDFTQAVEDGTAAAFAQVYRHTRRKLVIAMGCATRCFMDPLVQRAGLQDVLEPLYVQNAFFGGNVDVTGLLTGQDVGQAFARYCNGSDGANEDGEGNTVQPVFALMKVVLNHDGVMLDGLSPEQVAQNCGSPVHVVDCNASIFMQQAVGLLRYA